MRKGEEEEKRREIPATSEILLISVVHVAIEYDMQVYCIGTCRLIIRFCYVHATWCHLKVENIVLCFYPITKTQVEVWRTRNAVETQINRQVFPQLFQVLSHFHKYFYGLIETWRKCLISATKNKKTTCLL